MSNQIQISKFKCQGFLLLGFLIFFVIWILSFGFSNEAGAGTNISSAPLEHWAWNDVIGWIDFYFDDVEVTPAKIKGYANSSVGYISFDCGSSPNGNVCNPPTLAWKVLNDSSGNLSGWAWSDAIGWISFDCHNPGTGGSPPDYSCVTSNYQVKIGSAGRFTGWAWNDVVGWISFNCSDPGSCGTSDYKVRTSWSAGAATGTLVSSIFDTGVPGGVGFNSLMWRCDAATSTVCQPAGTAVKFQFASSNSTSTLTLIGPNGTSLTSDTYNPTGPSTPIALNRLYHNNHRYFRYKIFLETNVAQTASPRVDDVIVNWSP